MFAEIIQFMDKVYFRITSTLFCQRWSEQLDRNCKETSTPSCFSLNDEIFFSLLWKMFVARQSTFLWFILRTTGLRRKTNFRRLLSNILLLFFVCSEKYVSVVYTSLFLYKSVCSEQTVDVKCMSICFMCVVHCYCLFSDFIYIKLHDTAY